jgi:hypothetical protein
MGPTALLTLRRKCVLGIFITRKNPPVGLEPATEYPVGSVASALTTEGGYFQLTATIKTGMRSDCSVFRSWVLVPFEAQIYSAFCSVVLFVCRYRSSDDLALLQNFPKIIHDSISTYF